MIWIHPKNIQWKQLQKSENFLCEGILSILGFQGHTVYTTTQLCLCVLKQLKQVGLAKLGLQQAGFGQHTVVCSFLIYSVRAK